jgi:uncharacterized RDD family membrane protein YckC/tetratricopeptide (TPR) repeat protein
MVISDWSLKRRAASIEVRLDSRAMPVLLARPLDRLAAAIIDTFILLIPLYLLLSAPLKRWMMTSFILGSEPDFVATILAMIGLATFLLVGYQTLCHYFKGATLGKRIFDLQVVPMFEGQKVGFWDHCLRSFLWVFELLLLGLPWLSVFSNPKRRPLHDRMCDTVVVTRSPAGVRGPLGWERALVRGLFAMILAVIALVVSIQIRGTLDKLKMEKSLSAIVDRDLGDCEVVDAAAASEEESDDVHQRLKLAMTLYAAGLADRSCLESEVEGEIARQIPVSPITYLAQAFIYADDAEISNSYLDEVCENAPGTVECSMSQLVTSWSDEDWQAVEEILKAAPKGSGYMEVWGVRHYMKQAAYNNALGALDELIGHRELAEFSLAQRVKALYNNFKEPEAVAAYKQAVLTLPPDQGEDLGSWICSQQLQNGCGARKETACSQVLPEGRHQEIDFERPAHALANVLALECAGEHDVDYASFADAVKDEDWRLFFRANVSRQKEQKAAAAEMFKELLKSDTAPELLRVEAVRRWVQFATPAQMEGLAESWTEHSSREGWVKIGNLLFERLAEQRNAELALRVARRLASDEVLSPVAVKILAGFDATNRSGDRRPAQVKAKEQIKQLLDSFGEQE